MGRLLTIYGLIAVYFILTLTVLTPANVPFYNTLVVPIAWILIAGISYYFALDYSSRIKKEWDKLQSVFIVMIIYIIVYFSLGLFIGFQRTPYSKDMVTILKNLWAFGGIIVLEEITRNAIVRMSKKKMWSYVLITIFLTILQLNLLSFVSSLTTFKSSFIYICSMVLPVVANNILLTYLSYIAGIKSPILYRVILTLPPFIVPIIPDLNWFLTAAIGVILPIFIYIYLNYIHVKYVERFNRKNAKKYNPIGYIPVFGVLILLILFVVGVFKYQPVAVMSGSMSPYFDRGDAVVIEKLTDVEKDELKKDDIIQFAKGDRYYIHRIIDIRLDENLNREFVTKGDFNNSEDIGTVKYGAIVGKMKFFIPFIGYPSVWLSETIG